MERGSPATPVRHHVPFRAASAANDELEAELLSYLTPEVRPHHVSVASWLTAPQHKRLVRSEASSGSSSNPIVVETSPALSEDERALRRLQEEEDLRVAMEVYQREERQMRVDRLYHGHPVADASPPAARYSRPPTRSNSGGAYRGAASFGSYSVPPSVAQAPLMPARPPFVPRARGRARGGAAAAGREEWARMAEAERALESNDYEALLALEEKMGKVERGLSAAQVAAFPLGHWAAPPAQCTICMEDMQQGDAYRTLSCLDKFHPPCIDKWLKTHTTCPVCRHDLTT